MAKKNNKETKSEIDGAEHKAAAVKTKGAGKARGMKEKFTPDSERQSLEVEPKAVRPKDFSPKEAQNLSGQASARQPKVFVKTFGWPLSTL